MPFADLVKKESLRLRRYFTGEDVLFHTLKAVSNVAVDASGDPIDPEETATYEDTAVRAKHVRAIDRGDDIVKTFGGEFQDSDLVLDMDASYEETINDTKLAKGYVERGGFYYEITLIKQVRFGGVTSRFIVGLRRREI